MPTAPSAAEIQRAYSLLEIKSIDEDQRILTGIASTPSPDRMGDIVEPKGAEFKLPIPLLWQHRHDQPIGEVFAAKVTADGIEVKARIVKITEAGTLKDRVDEAWQSIKSGLVKGLSIGFRGIEEADIVGTYGIRFIKWLWLELSAVTIPANADCTIQTVKSLDAPFLAATGTKDGRPNAPRVRGSVRRLTSREDTSMKTYAEQIKEFEATRAAKQAERDALQQKASTEGRAKSEDERTQFQTLSEDIADIDKELADLKVLAQEAVTKATPAAGGDPAEAARAREGREPIARVSEVEVPKGIRFARYAICKAAAAMALKEGEFVTPFDLAKQRYPSDLALQKSFSPETMRAKSAVAGSTTYSSNNLSDLVPYQVLESDFIEFLRGKTIVDRFGQNGIPALRRVPFNVRVGGFSGGTTGYWKGEGKPVTVSRATSTNVSLAWATVSGLTAITKELARHSTPSAEMAVRNDLGDAVITRMDIDFVDPSKAAVANTSPASITYGIAATGPSGTAAVNVRRDAATLFALFAAANLGRSNLVWVMSDTMLGNIEMMVNALGQPDFLSLQGDNPRLFRHPVIASEKLTALGSPSTQMIVLVKADEVYLADDGGVDVEVSDTASIEMLDSSLVQDGTAGTGTSLVSLWQSGMLGLMANREVTWKLRRSTAVQYISPAAYAPPSS